MEYFENLTLGSASLKPTLLLPYVDNTFILWPHQENEQVLFDHVSSIKPFIHFTMGKVKDSQISFVDL